MIVDLGIGPKQQQTVNNIYIISQTLFQKKVNESQLNESVLQIDDQRHQIYGTFLEQMSSIYS